MPTTSRSTTRYTATVAAPTRLVFDLVADPANWATFTQPAVCAEPLGGDSGSERFQHWWLVDDDSVRTWQAEWRFDTQHLRIDCAVAANGLRGTWRFQGVAGKAEMTLEVTGHDEDSVTTEDFQTLFESVVAAAEHDRERADLVVDFEDMLFVSGSLSDGYAYLYEADKWPERIPHVSALTLTEDVENIQFFDMTTSTPDGSSHVTRSVRICLPDNKIVYKQVQLPVLLTAHSGHWRFLPTREGFLIGARHVAAIKPSALSALGAGTTVLDARKYLRRVLSANSMSNLRLAKAYAEERAGV